MKVKIHFDFDTETEKVSNLKVKVIDKEKTSFLSKTLVTLNKTSLKLNQEILDYLNIGVDQKVTLTINDDGIFLSKPVDAKIKTDSYRVTSKFTINVRGNNQEKLLAFGGEFNSVGILNGIDGIIKLIPITKSN